VKATLTTTESGTVRAVERASAVLTAFSIEQPELSLAQLAEAAGTAPSTTHRILASLAAQGLIGRSENGKLYRLGPRAAALGAVAMWNHHPGEAVQEILGALRDDVQESVGVSRRTGRDATVIARASSRLTLAANITVGTIFPGHATSAGRTLLAALPDTEVSRLCESTVFERLTAATPAGFDELMPLLENIRRQGYALEREEYAEGVTCVAVPVPVSVGSPRLAVGMTASATRWTDDDLVKAVPRLQEAARKVALSTAGGLED